MSQSDPAKIAAQAEVPLSNENPSDFKPGTVVMKAVNDSNTIIKELEQRNPILRLRAK